MRRKKALKARDKTWYVGDRYDSMSLSLNSAASPAQIDVAVKFLNNPRVVGSPLDQKKAFLKKKGEFLLCRLILYIFSG